MGEQFRPGMNALTRTSRHFVRQDMDDYASDSGVCTGTNHADLNDDCGSRGVFDYHIEVPTTPTLKAELKLSADHGDVAIDVDTSPVEFSSSIDELKSSDEDDDEGYGLTQVKSRFDRDVCTASAGIEMRQFDRTPRQYYENEEYIRDEDDLQRQYKQESINSITHMSNSLQYDESVPADDSDEDGLQAVRVESSSSDKYVSLDNVSLRQPLFNENIPSYGAVKSKSYRSRDDDYCASLEHGPLGRPSRSSNEPFLAKTQQMYSNIQQVDQKIPFPLSQSSDSVHVRKTERHTGPPFGDPVRTEHVSEAAANLLPSYGRPKNMPEGLPIDDMKKKKKKKKKDDGEPVSAEADENGNPIEGVTSGSGGGGRYGSKTLLVDQTGASTSGMPGSSQDADKKKRKKKSKEQGKTINVEDIPGYRGNKMGVDDLVSYIETDKSKKKKVKNGGAAGQTVQAAILPQQQRTPAPVDVNIKKVLPIITTNKKKKSGKVGKDDADTNSDLGKEEDESQTRDVINIVKSNRNKPPRTTLNSVDNNKSWTDDEEEVEHKRSGRLPVENSGSSSSSKASSSIEHHPTARNNVMVSADDTNLLNLRDKYRKDFIFTDYMESQIDQEEEFKVVSKKHKKRMPVVRGGREMQAWAYKAHSIDYYDSVPRSSSQSVRSITPPPAAPVPPPPVAVVVYERAGRERAFSPSAFPSLGSSVARAGRRNSTGNADPIEHDVDLSDVESVKSDSKVVACNPAAVVSPVSYAHIAAGGHKPKELPTAAPPVSRERRYSDGALAADSFPAIPVAVDAANSIAARTSSSGDLHTGARSTGFMTPTTTAAKCASEPPIATHISAPTSPLAQSSSSSSCSSSSSSAVAAKPTKPKNNNKAAKLQSTSNSSVIFLDRKYDNPQLDISFGFESDLATTPAAAVAPAPASSATTNVSLKLANSAPLNGLIMPTSHHLPHGGLSFEAAMGVEQSGPSIRDLVGEAPNPEVQVTDTTFPPLPSKEKTPPPKTQQQHEEEEEEDEDDEEQHTHIPKELDPNYQCGKFDLHRAVAYLYREWEKVSQLAIEDPAKVIIFKSS